MCHENLDRRAEVKGTVYPYQTLSMRLQVSPMVDPVVASDPRVVCHMLDDERMALEVLTDYCNTLQPELKPHMRKIVTDWMLEVCEDQEAGSEVFLLAVHYLDTFLSTTVIRKSQFQLAAASCLLLASKYVAVAPISGLQLVLYTDHSISLQELLHWEMQVLSSLRWQLGVPTTISFLNQLVPRLASLSSLPPHLLATLTRHATTIATLAATEYALLLAPRSVIAAASLQAAFNGLRLTNSDQLAMEVCTVVNCPLDMLARSTIALEAVLAPSTFGQVKDGVLPAFPFHAPCHGNEGNTTPTNTFEVLIAEGA